MKDKFNAVSFIYFFRKARKKESRKHYFHSIHSRDFSTTCVLASNSLNSTMVKYKQPAMLRITSILFPLNNNEAWLYVTEKKGIALYKGLTGTYPNEWGYISD